MNSKIFSIFLAVAVFLVSVTACATGVSARVSNIYLTNAIDDTNKITTFAPTDTIFVFFEYLLNNRGYFGVRKFYLRVIPK